VTYLIVAFDLFAFGLRSFSFARYHKFAIAILNLTSSKMKSTALIASFALGAAAQAPKPAQPNPAPVPFGPKPMGCSKFEVLVGMSHCLPRLQNLPKYVTNSV